MRRRVCIRDVGGLPVGRVGLIVAVIAKKTSLPAQITLARGRCYIDRETVRELSCLDEYVYSGISDIICEQVLRVAGCLRAISFQL